MLRKKIGRLLAMYLVIAGLLAACSDNNTPSNSSANTSVTQPPVGQNNGGEPLVGISPGAIQPVEQLLTDPTSRSFSYAGLEFKVTKGAIITQPAATNPTQAQLNLALSVTNPTKESVRISAGLLQLKLGNGTLLKQPLDLSLLARDTKPYELNFAAPLNTKWAGAQLQLDEDGKEPTLIALDGPATTSPYPLSLTAGQEVQVKNPKVTYKITKASLDLDAQGERVEKGKRFLVMSVLATNRETQNDVLVSDENFRVVTGGKPQSPDKIDPPATGVQGLNKQEFELAFAVPAATTKLTFQVGEIGKGMASIELDLSATAPKNNSTDASPTIGSTATSPVATIKPIPPTAVKASPAPAQATVVPTSAASSDTGSAAGSDACALFSKEDFKAVFGRDASDPDREDFSEWTSCNYQLSDPALQADSVAYGLEIRVLKGDFDRQKFDSTYEVLLSQLQKVTGLGDVAYLQPSAQNHSAASLFILKGKTSFTLSVLEPSSVNEGQMETEVKAAAQKILKHF